MRLTQATSPGLKGLKLSQPKKDATDFAASRYEKMLFSKNKNFRGRAYNARHPISLPSCGDDRRAFKLCFLLAKQSFADVGSQAELGSQAMKYPKRSFKDYGVYS